VFSNTNPMRPYRGNGRPEFGYVIERMVDEAAAELGVDPVELRRRNLIPPEAMPFKTGLIFTYDCGEFSKTRDKDLELRDLAGLGGWAGYLTTEKIVAKAKAIAAHLLEAAEADIDFADGVFKIAGTDRTVSLADIAATAWDPPSLPDGMEPGLVASAAYSAKQQNFPNGTHICELEIDPETGMVEILNYSVVDDVGTVLNPLLLEG